MGKDFFLTARGMVCSQLVGDGGSVAVSVALMGRATRACSPSAVDSD